MSQLTGYANHSPTQSWAKVILDNGEPLHFSFDPSGTSVKVSKHGLLGKKLFKEDADSSTFVGESLWAIYRYQADIPFELCGERQRGYIAAALCSDTAESYAEKLLATRYQTRMKDLCHC